MSRVYQCEFCKGLIQKDQQRWVVINKDGGADDWNKQKDLCCVCFKKISNG